jgi:hypothetical protein
VLPMLLLPLLLQQGRLQCFGIHASEAYTPELSLQL